MHRQSARVLTITMALGSLLTTSSALACLHRGWSTGVPADPVKRAQKLLVKGKHAKTARVLAKAYPRLATTPVPSKVRKGTNAAKLRVAASITALVAIRSGGEFGPSSRKPAQSKAQRLINRGWAVQTLHDLSSSRPDDTAAKARLAEGLTAIGETAKAREILEALVAKDMMPTGRAYAVLAALRGAAGDMKGRHQAASTCYQRAKRKTQCALPKVATGPKRLGKVELALLKAL